MLFLSPMFNSTKEKEIQCGTLKETEAKTGSLG